MYSVEPITPLEYQDSYTCAMSIILGELTFNIATEFIICLVLFGKSIQKTKQTGIHFCFIFILKFQCLCSSLKEVIKPQTN